MSLQPSCQAADGEEISWFVKNLKAMKRTLRRVSVTFAPSAFSPFLRLQIPVPHPYFLRPSLPFNEYASGICTSSIPMSTALLKWALPHGITRRGSRLRAPHSDLLAWAAQGSIFWPFLPSIQSGALAGKLNANYCQEH
jgi:hypothetical protein